MPEAKTATARSVAEASASLREAPQPLYDSIDQAHEQEALAAGQAVSTTATADKVQVSTLAATSAAAAASSAATVASSLSQPAPAAVTGSSPSKPKPPPVAPKTKTNPFVLPTVAVTATALAADVSSTVSKASAEQTADLQIKADSVKEEAKEMPTAEVVTATPVASTAGTGDRVILNEASASVDVVAAPVVTVIASRGSAAISNSFGESDTDGPLPPIPASLGGEHRVLPIAPEPFEEEEHMALRPVPASSPTPTVAAAIAVESVSESEGEETDHASKQPGKAPSPQQPKKDVAKSNLLNPFAKAPAKPRSPEPVRVDNPPPQLAAVNETVDGTVRAAVQEAEGSKVAAVDQADSIYDSIDHDEQGPGWHATGDLGAAADPIYEAFDELDDLSENMSGHTPSPAASRSKVVAPKDASPKAAVDEQPLYDTIDAVISGAPPVAQETDVAKHKTSKEHSNDQSAAPATSVRAQEETAHEAGKSDHAQDGNAAAPAFDPFALTADSHQSTKPTAAAGGKAAFNPFGNAAPAAHSSVAASRSAKQGENVSSNEALSDIVSAETAASATKATLKAESAIETVSNAVASVANAADHKAGSDATAALARGSPAPSSPLGSPEAKRKPTSKDEIIARLKKKASMDRLMSNEASPHSSNPSSPAPRPRDLSHAPTEGSLLAPPHDEHRNTSHPDSDHQSAATTATTHSSGAAGKHSSVDSLGGTLPSATAVAAAQVMAVNTPTGSPSSSGRMSLVLPPPPVPPPSQGLERSSSVQSAHSGSSTSDDTDIIILHKKEGMPLGIGISGGKVRQVCECVCVCV
jgi:trimeric autotransporter adhesin